MKKFPLARRANIVVQAVGKEILIYDLTTNKAYSLNETSAIVYQACDGRNTFDELKIKHNFTDDIIFLALDELKKENLLEDNQSYNSPFAGMSRREAIRRVGFASMIALPIMSSLIAPTAAMAASVVCGAANRPNTCACNASSQCASGCCKSNGSAQSGQNTCVTSGGGNTCYVTCPSISPCNNAVTIPTGCPCSLNCSNCQGVCNTITNTCQ